MKARPGLSERKRLAISMLKDLKPHEIYSLETSPAERRPGEEWGLYKERRYLRDLIRHIRKSEWKYRIPREFHLPHMKLDLEYYWEQKAKQVAQEKAAKESAF